MYPNDSNLYACQCCTCVVVILTATNKDSELAARILSALGLQNEKVTGIIYVCMYVCIYVCMYVCMHVHNNIDT